MIDGIANLFPDIKYVIIASTSYDNIKLFHEVSAKEFCDSSGYMAILK